MPEPSFQKPGRGPRRSRPRPIAELLGQVMQRTGLSGQQAYRCICEAWMQVVPETIAQRTRVLSFRGGALSIGVESAPLFEELRSFRAKDLLLLLNQHLGAIPTVTVQVRKVEFRRA